jgi:cobalt transporter subunit CbtB
MMTPTPSPAQSLGQAPALQTLAGTRAGAIPALLAMAAGVMLMYVVGFSGSEVLHNAAHDSRHSFSFPCH